ncbi:MAG: metal-dependent hydrolase, partial [Pseudomonadota bacterium]
FTVYGTQLALPFSDHPFGLGSVFIIDPLYTLPLLIGAGWALATRGDGRGLRANVIGLVLSTAYLGWGVVAQQRVERVAQASLAFQGIVAERILITPTPFNSLLWRIVAMSGDRYHEGFYSLLDKDPQIAFDAFARGHDLAVELQANPGAQRVAAFSKGFFKLQQDGTRVLITDLRMGQEPDYIFSFAVAERQSPPQALPRPEQVGTRPDVRRLLQWLWRRMLGEPMVLPR